MSHIMLLVGIDGFEKLRIIRERMHDTQKQ